MAPGPVAEVAGLHDGARLGREPLPTVPAPERHRLVGGARLAPDRAAVVAADTIRPPLLDEPPFRGGVIGEHLEELDEAEPATVTPTRS